MNPGRRVFVLTYPAHFQYYRRTAQASLFPGFYRMPKQYRLDVHISTELIDSARKAAHARSFDSVAGLVGMIPDQDLRKASQQDQLESIVIASIDRLPKNSAASTTPTNPSSP